MWRSLYRPRMRTRNWREPRCSIRRRGRCQRCRTGGSSFGTGRSWGRWRLSNHPPRAGPVASAPGVLARSATPGADATGLATSLPLACRIVVEAVEALGTVAAEVLFRLGGFLRVLGEL